jgi:hypothetical protein
MRPPPPHTCRGAVILAERAWEFHWKKWTTNKQQSKVDEGWLLRMGSQCRARTPPPKDTICHWDWGEGVAEFNLAQKGMFGDAIIMRWTMTKMKMMSKGGKQGKKY